MPGLRLVSSPKYNVLRMRPVPLTSKRYAGALVLIPTFAEGSTVIPDALVVTPIFNDVPPELNICVLFELSRLIVQFVVVNSTLNASVAAGKDGIKMKVDARASIIFSSVMNVAIVDPVMNVPP